LETPGFITLSAGIRNLLARFMKFKNLDSGFGGIENPIVFMKTMGFSIPPNPESRFLNFIKRARRFLIPALNVMKPGVSKHAL
jgi:hypothetical protein